MNNNTMHIQTSPPPTGASSILEMMINHDRYTVPRENIQALFNKLSRKVNTGARGSRVGPGWLKYEWNENIWNLDDDSDYAIFVWRQQQTPPPSAALTLHFQNPDTPLPSPSEYRNASFYLFRPNIVSKSPPLRARSIRSSRSRRSSKHADDHDGIPQHKKIFEAFHAENGVRTVTGKIGPVDNVRMLLKNGYRHVYLSRNFALKHAFIPRDAAPGQYGYGGLINIGQWPLTLGHTTTEHTVYLSEETHFDVILGRAFMERRGIKTDPLDPTSVICLDTGEKLDCEVVVIRDGKGDIVTVT